MERRRITRTVWTATLSVCLLGCAGSQRPDLADPGAGSAGRQQAPADPQGGARAEEAADRTAATAQNAFGFKLLAELTGEGAAGNVFLSPLSISLALSLVYNGVGGATRDAVGGTLQLAGMSLEQVNKGNAALQESLAGPDPGVRVDIANGLWVNQGLRFDPDFLERAGSDYKAEASALRLQDPSALAAINGWVSRKTDKKIETLFTSDDLHNATAVLANAIYFKGTWATPFDKALTRDGDFTLPDGKKKTLPMMSRTGVCKYLRGQDFEAIGLPYGKGRVSMFVFLPDAGSSLGKFLGGLSAQKWDDWMSRFREAEIEVALPRFTVAYEAELNEPLTGLGMGVAFGPGADFAPMGLPGHYLSLVKHKAVMEVNEEGTEAAAATGGVATISLKPRVAVNRPFFCAIRDNQTGAVLFMGAIADPR